MHVYHVSSLFYSICHCSLFLEPLDADCFVGVATEKQIIHRDVKSSNILLTERMRAKVADFGFAKDGEVDSEKTHISTKVKGTIGYLDPDYMVTYQLTPKSDVYSFGILLLEILTARRPVESKRPFSEKVTLRWVSYLSPLFVKMWFNSLWVCLE